MARTRTPAPTASRVFYLTAALATSLMIPLLGIPVYFRTDDVHWLGWAQGHANPFSAFDPGQNLFGYYRPIPTVVWWLLYRLFGFEPLGYQLVLGLLAVLSMVPLFRIGRRLGGGDAHGCLAVLVFHAGFFPFLYYVYWFSALTFGVELLFLLLALDAFTDGERYPGKPGRFVLWALLAGLSKQPALVIIPVVGTLLLWRDSFTGRPDATGIESQARPTFFGGGETRRRVRWTLGLWSISLLLLGVTPFVVKRPDVLAAMTPEQLGSFVHERFRFYAGQILRSPAGVIVPAAAALAVAGGIGARTRGWLWAAAAGAAGFLLGKVDPELAFPLFLLAGVAAVVRVPASLPWFIGFVTPLVLLLGVDFHVATYLLEPAAVLVPAVILWAGPSLELPASAFSRWLDRTIPRAGACLVPAGLAGLLLVVAYPRIGPVRTMRDVRATFRAAVDDLVRRAPRNAVIGSLSYDERGETYADIRSRPFEQRVVEHKTMNPAQLEKFLRLRGRADLLVLPVNEAVRKPGPKLLLSMNATESAALASIPGTREIASWRRGGVVSALYEQPPGWPVAGDSLR